MGRLPKIGVDYFTHDVHAATGPTLFTVQNSFGNDGYALWFFDYKKESDFLALSFDCVLSFICRAHCL